MTNPSQQQLGDGEALPLDTVYHVLQSERRRLALGHIRRAGRTDIDEVADVVAAVEADDKATNEQRKRVYISLYQSHLPLLDTEDVISYDEQTRSIAPDEHLDRFEPYLQRPEPTVESTGQTALVAGLACLAVVAAGLFVGGGSITPGLTTGLVGLTALYTTIR